MRTIKTLGIATAMALALIAFVGAASASANNFKAQVEPETWSGSLTGKNHVLFLNGESFTCSGVSFSGETTGKTVSQVTVTPTLSSCAHESFAAAWTMNGCKFRLNPGAGPALVGSLDIVGCVTPMSHTTVYGCTTEIGNQSGLGTVTYKNVATSPATITMVASINSLTFTRSGTACTGPQGTFNNGTYTGEWTTKGFTKPGGVQVAVEVESTPAPPFTKFAVESAPATISGTHSTLAKRMTAGGLLQCEKYALSGTLASTTSATVTVVPSYSNCTFAGEAIPDSFVSAGGCSYAFHVNGEVDIVGATCASNPMSITRSGCVVTVGPQSGLSLSLAFKNEGSGKTRSVSMAGAADELTFTAVGLKCFAQGTFSTGNINSTSKLAATTSGGSAQGISIE